MINLSKAKIIRIHTAYMSIICSLEKMVPTPWCQDALIRCRDTGHSMGFIDFSKSKLRYMGTKDCCENQEYEIVKIN